MKLSIIVPAHNEEKRIEKTLQEYVKFFEKKFKNNYEIIVILNGCTDDTLGIVKKIARKYNAIEYRNYVQAGKGFAITQGLKIAEGDLIGFVDADLSTSPQAFYDLVRNIKDYDGIIASRYMKGSIVNPKQSFARIVASRIFNFLVRVLFLFSYSDTQCGAKLFKKKTIEKILPNLTITNWAFDIDLLYQAKKAGLKVKEQPTFWQDKGASKLDLKKTSMQMFFAVVQLKILNSKAKIFYKVLRPIGGYIYKKLR